MNNIAENTGITWEMIDGKPIAHLHISMDADSEQLLELGRRIYAMLAEMKWSAATLLEAGALGRGLRNMHLLHKRDYEASKSCPALCGKSAEWDIVHILERDLGRAGLCKKCYELATSPELGGWPAKQEGEGEHGSV